MISQPRKEEAVAAWGRTGPWPDSRTISLPRGLVLFRHDRLTITITVTQLNQGCHQITPPVPNTGRFHLESLSFRHSRSFPTFLCVFLNISNFQLSQGAVVAVAINLNCVLNNSSIFKIPGKGQWVKVDSRNKTGNTEWH